MLDDGRKMKGPIAKTWGIFSSPCDGVVWDSKRHCWIAQPVEDELQDDGNPPSPETFPPAVYGMEGAKAEAIKRRKALEAERYGQQQLCRDEGGVDAVSPLPGSSMFAKGVPGRVGQGKAHMHGFDPYQGSVKTAVRRVVGTHSETVAPQSVSRSPPRSPSQLHRKRQETSGLEGTSRSQPKSGPARRHGGSTPLMPRGSVPRSRETSAPNTREASPVVAVGAAGPNIGSRRPHSPAERSGRQSELHNARSKGEKDRRQADDRRHDGVLAQVEDLRRKLDQLQQEAKRERSEKEALKQDNERLQRRIDELSLEQTASSAEQNGSLAESVIECNHRERSSASANPSRSLSPQASVADGIGNHGQVGPPKVAASPSRSLSPQASVSSPLESLGANIQQAQSVTASSPPRSVSPQMNNSTCNSIPVGQNRPVEMIMTKPAAALPATPYNTSDLPCRNVSGMPAIGHWRQPLAPQAQGCRIGSIGRGVHCPPTTQMIGDIRCPKGATLRASAAGTSGPPAFLPVAVSPRQ